MICSIGVDVWDASPGDSMAGPQSLSVAARFRLTSVTVALKSCQRCELVSNININR